MLTRQQYIEAGEKHTRNDIEVTTEVSMNIERNLNGHMRWWAGMTQLGKSWNQEDRSVSNLLIFGLAVCPTTLLVKDHKPLILELQRPQGL